jgi:predicted flap endonuclease-1-like 5' DNA nuclease
MNTTTLIVIAVIVVVALLLVLLVRGRRQRVTFSDQAPLARPAAPRVDAEPAPPPAAIPEEGHDVGAEIAAAVEDVVDQFIGIDAHPSGQPASIGAGDPLTRLKGLGPKAAARLTELGVTRFDQIASWNDADVNAIDAQMGAFKGRIRRDRWVDQAKLLAGGDTAAFETEFGKLGS